MIDVRLHGKPIESVFELLGRRENDLTYSIGWALAQCASLRSAFSHRLFGERAPPFTSVELQERSAKGGITDIELKGEDTHVIVEAKRGWDLPTEAQLLKYAPRFDRQRRLQALVTMSECSEDYASSTSPLNVGGISVKHISWRDIQRMAAVRSGSHAEKRLLDQLRRYIERIVKMQRLDSNLAYVVSLGSGTPSWSKLSWIEIVTKRRHYFHIMGERGWPNEPPNYLAFRYGGRLRSVHHVDRCELCYDPRRFMPEVTPSWTKPHFLYWLGPAIEPSGEVPTGGLYANGRVWAAIDLLLTSKSVKEARDLTKQRLNNAE